MNSPSLLSNSELQFRSTGIGTVCKETDEGRFKGQYWRPKRLILMLSQHFKGKRHVLLSNMSCLGSNCSFMSLLPNFDCFCVSFPKVHQRNANSPKAVALHMILSPQTVYLSQHVVLWSVTMAYITSLLLCQCISLIECWGSCCCSGNVPRTELDRRDCWDHVLSHFVGLHGSLVKTQTCPRTTPTQNP